MGLSSYSFRSKKNVAGQVSTMPLRNKIRLTGLLWMNQKEQYDDLENDDEDSEFENKDGDKADEEEDSVTEELINRAWVLGYSYCTW